jgi:MFS family permease
MKLRLLEHPAFARYWLGQSVSVAGSMMRELTIAWLVLAETGSALWLAGTALARVGTMLLLTPWSSRLADRVSRRSLVLAAESGSLAVSLILAALAFVDALPAPALVVAAALLGGLHAVEAPARNVLVHDLVSSETLLPALSLFTASQGAARVLGPALGGLLLDRVGASVCFLVDAASYLVLLATVLTLPKTPPAPGASRKGLVATFRTAMAEPVTRRVLLLLMLLGIVAASYQPLMPAIATDLLGLGADGLGALQACAALGALTIGLLLGRGLLPFSEDSLLRRSALLLPLPLAVLGFLPLVLVAAVAVAAASALISGGEAAANTRLQVLAAPDERARHVGIYTILVHLAPVGGWLLALTAEALGLGPALVGLAVLIALLAVPLQVPVRSS